MRSPFPAPDLFSTLLCPPLSPGGDPFMAQPPLAWLPVMSSDGRWSRQRSGDSPPCVSALESLVLAPVPIASLSPGRSSPNQTLKHCPPLFFCTGVICTSHLACLVSPSCLPSLQVSPPWNSFKWTTLMHFAFRWTLIGTRHTCN